MPGGDKTGPMGVGQRTGRGRGVCTGFFGPGYMNPAPGQGRMMRREQGMGRGFRRGRGGFGKGFGIKWWKTSAESAEKKED